MMLLQRVEELLPGLLQLTRKTHFITPQMADFLDIQGSSLKQQGHIVVRGNKDKSTMGPLLQLYACE